MKKELYWKKALKQTKISANNGCLFPLNTKIITNKYYKDSDFIIRQLDTHKFVKNKKIGPKINPFNPWDRKLEIDQIGNKHQLILNKYPVQKGHILLITNSWKPQDGWLDNYDFIALREVNDDTSGLWFFNSGPLAGASQPHRHFQLLRRTIDQQNCPRENWFLNLNKNEKSNKKLKRNIIVVRLNNSAKETDIYQKYLKISKKIGLGDPQSNEKPKSAYNLLITSNWMAIIKRSNDHIYGYSMNGLGFAGYILVTEKSDIEYLKTNGPEKLLENFV